MRRMDEVNQEESEQNDVDGMKKEVDSTGGIPFHVRVNFSRVRIARRCSVVLAKS